jgi:hypothetical protein
MYGLVFERPLTDAERFATGTSDAGEEVYAEFTPEFQTALSMIIENEPETDD